MQKLYSRTSALWLNLVVLKHSCRINGYDVLNLTELNILDKLPEINVGIKHIVKGKKLAAFPKRRVDMVSEK